MNTKEKRCAIIDAVMLNVSGFIAKLLARTGLELPKLALKSQILPATLYHLRGQGKRKPKGFDVDTLIKLKLGTGLSWNDIGKMLLEEYDQ